MQRKPKASAATRLGSVKPHGDIRREVTREIIWHSLYDLLRDSVFDEVTVSQICAHAGVNRSTFYNHFETKYALLEYGMRIAIPERMGLPNIFNTDSRVSITEIHSVFFKHVEKHPHYWLHILTGTSYEVAHRCLVDETTVIFETMHPKSRPAGMPARALSCMFVGAMLSLAEWWLENGCASPTAEELSDHFRKLWHYNTKR